MSSDRGASQQTFDFGDDVEPTLPANLLRQELTDPASIDTPSLSVLPDADLMEQIVDPRNLDRAWRQVKSNRGAPGPDGMTIKAFESWCPEHWPAVKQQLLDGTYRPSPVRRKTIPKDGGGERSLGIPTVRDRVVQTALVHVIEPIFDFTFYDRSFGFRHGRGCHHALECVEQLLNAGYVYVVDADLKSYFDTIPKDRLMQLVQQSISDRRVLRLIQKYLDQELDHHMATLNHQMVRYADDFVILCRTAEEAQAALAAVQQWVTANGLTLHPTKTQIVDSREKRFAFLGYSFRGNLCFPREKSHTKLQDRLRALTPRKSGESLHCTIQKLNSTLRGWFGYFHDCHPSVFSAIDSHLRARLRRLLLKRHSRNPKRLCRTWRWPNAFFAEQGYTALVKPMLVSFNPIWATTDWRAVCGRTACTVLREGSRNSMRFPYPYQ
ncbi:MAG: group II intron reverse transcriptase/maturase [Planctomycetaceae bacterium]